MKMIRLFTLVSIAHGILNGTEIDIPLGWVAKFDDIISGMQGITNSFITSKELYNNLEEQIDHASDYLERSDIKRISIVKCINEAFDRYNKQLQDCQSETTQLVLDIERAKYELNAELLALRSSTEREIAELQSEKTSLTTDYNTIKNIYDTAVGTNAEKAAIILDQMHAVSDRYDDMVEEKTKFLNALNQLIEKTDQANSRLKTDLGTLENDIC